jgi:hypothetical protein
MLTYSLAILQPFFEESEISRADGKVEISFLDDSHVAFLVLIDIIQNRVRRCNMQRSLPPPTFTGPIGRQVSIP